MQNFRNYDEAQINFSDNLNYIYGLNAQGKTNILEALFFLSCGKSHRTNRDINLLRESTEELYVRVKAQYGNGIEIEIQLTYNGSTRKKELSINGSRQQSIGELFGRLQLVFFSPEDLAMIKEGPAGRRRQADISLSQIKPSFYHDLSKYCKILMQKNILLKEVKKREKFTGTLDIWSEKLAEYGAKVICKRREYIEEIAEIAKKKHMVISDGKENLSIGYECFTGKEESFDEREIKEKLFTKYMENRDKEIFCGTTFIGPHRDDIIFLINDREAKAFASQGQQRSAVISFKMAQLELIKNVTGERPVLILDDVFSELDEERRNYLYNNLKDMQTFITGTEKDDIINGMFDDVKYIRVDKGGISDI